MKTQSNLDCFDTIAAQATAPGRGGVAIVRVSGPKVNLAIQYLLHRSLVPRQALYLPFYDHNHQIIDQGIALYFPAPHSFTGEDVLELHAHGGIVIVDLLLESLCQLGIRLARPGEFSERAFLNNKMDLTQAEAIADLIDASSKQAARLALRSLQGEFSKVIHTINQQIISLRLFIEAAIDFVDEEIDLLTNETIQKKIIQIHQDLIAVQQQAKQGNVLREGVKAVIIGKPNVGKSSLLNVLSEQELAIVTDIPGTTRDVLHHYIMISGVSIHVVDTAGLRDTTHIVEQEGIRRAHQQMLEADLILYLIDVSQKETIDLPKEALGRPLIVVNNKIDLSAQLPEVKFLNETIHVMISAKNNLGIDLLKEQILKLIGFEAKEEGLFLARRRHLEALNKTEQAILASLTLLNQSSRSSELIAEELRLAQLNLSEITGTFTADDLLGGIFSQFCIGK